MKLLTALLVLAGLALPSAGSFGLPRRSLVSVRIAARDDCRRLQSLGADVVNVWKDSVLCLATREQVERFRSAGFAVSIRLADYAAHDPCDFPSPFGFYHTYPQLRDSLVALAQRHPNICRLETLGYSVQGRLLLGLRVSDNVGLRENEPRVRLDGNIHGNEKIGCEVTLALAYALVDSYGVSPRVTALVNRTEILCAPMVNPDGAYANQRYNANGVDLNRDFGYMWDAWGNSPDWFSQAETQAFRLDCERNRYAMSISFHSGAKLVIYPWMYTPVPAADDALFKQLVWRYHTLTGYDTLQSYHWYQTHGQSFDCRYGLDGTLEITVELHELNPPAESLEYYGRLHQDAVLSFLERSLTGVQGTITDAVSGRPVKALVRVSPLSGGRDWFVYSSVENGDFHRPLLPGTYSLHVSANGYQDTVLAGVVVPDTLIPAVVVCALRPGPNRAGCGIVCVQQNDTMGLVQSSLTHWALGVPDQRAYSMSARGRLVLDLGAGSMIVNGPGPDLAVFEYPDTTDTILVSAGHAWNGPWTTIGQGIGTCSLDLQGAGIDSVRYLLLRDRDRRPNSNPAAGYDLDAVIVLNSSVGVSERSPERTSVGVSWPTIVHGVLWLPREPGTVPIFTMLDAVGRNVLDLQPGANDVSRLAPGVYFVRERHKLKPQAQAVRKVVVQ
jgi:hypothetical protein